MELEQTKRRLFKMADATVMLMRNHIKKAGKFNTGQLSNSIGWKVVQGGIQFYVAAPYAKYVISGRRKGAKQPPSWAIREWFKGANGRKVFESMKSKWKGISMEGATYVVAKSIKEKGIKPLDFYNPAINKLYSKDAFHELEAAFAQDLEKGIQKELNSK